jgi:hypothetical protein
MEGKVAWKITVCNGKFVTMAWHTDGAVTGENIVDLGVSPATAPENLMGRVDEVK